MDEKKNEVELENLQLQNSKLRIEISDLEKKLNSPFRFFQGITPLLTAASILFAVTQFTYQQFMSFSLEQNKLKNTAIETVLSFPINKDVTTAKLLFSLDTLYDIYNENYRIFFGDKGEEQIFTQHLVNYVISSEIDFYNPRHIAFYQILRENWKPYKKLLAEDIALNEKIALKSYNAIVDLANNNNLSGLIINKNFQTENNSIFNRRDIFFEFFYSMRFIKNKSSNFPKLWNRFKKDILPKLNKKSVIYKEKNGLIIFCLIDECNGINKLQ